MNAKYSPGPEMQVRTISLNTSEHLSLNQYLILSLQAKVLRLLATVYLEWDCQKYVEKALHAVSLANKVSDLSKQAMSFDILHTLCSFLKMAI